MAKLKDFINIELKKDMGIYHATDEFFCLFLNHIYEKEKKNILVVVNSVFEANHLYHSLLTYQENVWLFPMDDFLTSEALAISPDLRMHRLETLNQLKEKTGIVVTNLTGYLRFLPKKENYDDFFISLKPGDIISPQKLVEKLVSSGYYRDTIVNKTGEFGVRGFVVDVFPMDEENPVRIEFFDDEIESIRTFDPETQKSISTLKNILIRPFTEFLTQKTVEEEHLGKQKYLPLYEECDSILHYLDSPYTFFKDYNQLCLQYTEMKGEMEDYRKEKDSTFSANYMHEFDSIEPSFPIYYFSLDNLTPMENVHEMVDLEVKMVPLFQENEEQLQNFLSKELKEKKAVLICLKKYQLKGIQKHLNFPMIETDFDHIEFGKINFIEEEMNEGFSYQNIVVLTAKELFRSTETKKKYRPKYKYSSTIPDITKLSIGDYVIHETHGIGIYNGIKTLTLYDIQKDYIEVLYQGTDKIYIPVEKIDVLSKFSGREGVVPKINKLGGTEWKKTKNRIRSKVVDIADQLIQLYAERESRKGYAFSPDCDLSIDFEKNFPYELTKDQERAISQIKEDMESPVPMDRLLCGDVGFGKTEVAFVAAFKSILDSKQVLFLCPTTILSKQHYDNALIRFENFPVNIALLNRFTTQKEVNRILEGLQNGTIDMVIGTHRLLSDDIKLKDLGLLIIDEEQRFGVAHKEKLKQYKTNVDVLTLTATPIPRTLQMSLTGIRSLSLIETPPVNRYPIQTYVVEENKQILKDAIYKELSRKGQVFILYNRVQSIHEFSSMIQNIVPDAKIGIAHGQMNKNDLETTIYDFVNHQFDILICTTIIETGIDIPNVNTLIIMDADRFGLSQLYQIRGRVGRSDKFAYAYLMYQPFKTLTDTAVKRLNVIKEFTELGSGFSIATRDLSIRGAGDILGSEQAGFIDSVGIELYLKILEEEIQRKKGETVEEKEEDTSEKAPAIHVTTHIDDQYVTEDDLKIEIHRKINTISSKETFEEVKLELEDRFGKINEDIEIYMYEEWFEKLVEKFKLSHVRQTRNSIELVFPQEIVEKMDTEEVFMDAFQVTPMFRFLSRGSNLIIVLDIIKLEKHPIYYLVELLTKLDENQRILID